MNKLYEKHNCRTEAFEQLNREALHAFACSFKSIVIYACTKKFDFWPVALKVSIIANYGVKIKCKYLIFVSTRCV